MLYIFLFVTAIGLYSYFSQKNQIASVKRNGVRAVGTIIKNEDRQHRRQLGGNINSPTIRFITKEGKEIIGQPVIGFVTQYEVAVPSQVHVIYDSTNPEMFCLDME